MTSVILAGGENRRFPIVKGMLMIGGVPLVGRIVDVHRRIFRKVVISTNSPHIYFRFGCGMVGDVLDRRGPMTGIFSVMLGSNDEWFFVTACDMPFPNEALVRHIVSSAGEGDAVVPVFNSEPQPLHALYHRRVIPDMYVRIMEGRRVMKALLDSVATRYVPEDVVRRLDPEGRAFVNINTPEDLQNIQGGTLCSD